MTGLFISYAKTKTLSKLLQAFLEEHPVLADFYGRAPKLDNFEAQMAAKSVQYSLEKRQLLADCLQHQYKTLAPDPLIQSQINALKSTSTFCVTTGHQLNLMGGPLYFIYKIISVVNLSKALSKKYPNNRFIPVFWMASEDHDFKEINHFYHKDECFEWDLDAAGPVGRLSTKGLDSMFENFSNSISNDPAAASLKKIFKTAYLLQTNLADATRSLLYQLFGQDGVIVVDGDDPGLKRMFIPQLKNELETALLFKSVSSTNKELKSIDCGFKIQSNPRELNLFYILDGLRERIVEENGIFRVNNTEMEFGLKSIFNEIDQHPERFSPNVLMRPLYQETILPNLSYTGGGGELAYWLQLKSYFKNSKVDFPILMHRNSALLITEKQQKTLDALGLSACDLFLSDDELTAKLTNTLTQISIDLTPQKNHLKQQFQNLYKIANQTDASFYGAVAAQEQKQIKGLSNLEKRLLKAEKRKHAVQLEKALKLKAALFPQNTLQERHSNFSSFYSLYGPTFLKSLRADFQPFQQGFYILSL